MTEDSDGRLADRQAMLREQFGDGALVRVRCCMQRRGAPVIIIVPRVNIRTNV